MRELIRSLIRTGVPLAVAAIVGYLADQGIVITGDLRTDLAALLTFGAGLVYYLIVRVLGQRYPWVERLLGSPRPPTYPPPDLPATSAGSGGHATPTSG